MTQAAILAASGSPGTTQSFKNRLINGNFVIDQRNNGGSTTAIGYNLDRWAYYSNQSGKLSFQRSTDAPAGFYNSVLATSTSAFSIGASDRFIYSQNIEGFNTSDIGYGTSNAATCTLSFWVKSSLTGTFACSLNNSSGAYSYVTTYSIPTANIWTKISLTIPGSTAGSWNTGTNSTSICVNFDLGSGSTYTTSTLNTWQNAFYENATGAVALPSTNGATWYVTGCQFEVGTTATNFDFRSYGTELQLCQRYCYVWGGNSGNELLGWGVPDSPNRGECMMIYPVPLRANASVSFSTASNFRVVYYSGGAANVAVCNATGSDNNTPLSCRLYMPTGTAFSAGTPTQVSANNTTAARITVSAEL